MSNIFNQFAKSFVETSQGRIRTLPNGWVHSSAGSTNNQGVFLKPHVTQDGRQASLALSVLSAGNCPRPPLGTDAPHMSHGYSVPMKVCRKCPNHIKRRRRQPYPCCAILRKMRANGPSPAATLANMVEVAVNKVEEMMK